MIYITGFFDLFNTLLSLLYDFFSTTVFTFDDTSISLMDVFCGTAFITIIVDGIYRVVEYRED